MTPATIAELIVGPESGSESSGSESSGSESSESPAEGGRAPKGSVEAEGGGGAPKGDVVLGSTSGSAVGNSSVILDFCKMNFVNVISINIFSGKSNKKNHLFNTSKIKTETYIEHIHNVLSSF
jgi:hypothetical protein